MFSLSIMVGSGQWRLLYKTEETAKGTFEALQHPNHEAQGSTISDDFGQTCVIRPNAMHAFLLEDMNQSKLAAVELSLYQARTQNAAQIAAQSDPQLRTASRGQGPSVITPMGARF